MYGKTGRTTLIYLTQLNLVPVSSAQPSTEVFSLSYLFLHMKE